VESMVVQDRDGELGLDDLQEGDSLLRLQPGANHAPGAGGLVGRPLVEIERYYTEQALALTNGNREEAARMLGIGERTLYRIMQDWKAQDKIRGALTEVGGNVEEAAKLLGMKEAVMERKLKKWGMRTEGS